MLVDTRAGHEVWNLPAFSVGTEWLSETLFRFRHAHGWAVADAKQRLAWPLPELTAAIAAVGQQVCYSAEAEGRRTNAITCLDTVTGQQKSLLEHGEHATLTVIDRLAVDPTGRWLAFAYRRQAQPALSFRWTGVAHATKPLPPMVWADTIAIYDSQENSLRHLALPHLALVQQLAWSPDGVHLGLRLHREHKDPYTALVNGNLWSLNLATGHMRPLARSTIGRLIALRFPLQGGALLVNRGNEYQPQLQVLAPDKAPEPWQAGAVALPLIPPGPPWWKGDPPPWVAAAGEGKLEVLAASGKGGTWPWPAGAPEGHVTPDPSFRWVSVQRTNQGKSGQLLLLKR